MACSRFFRRQPSADKPIEPSRPDYRWIALILAAGARADEIDAVWQHVGPKPVAHSAEQLVLDIKDSLRQVRRTRREAKR